MQQNRGFLYMGGLLHILAFAIFTTGALGKTPVHHLCLDYNNAYSYLPVTEEGIKERPEDKFRSEPSWPAVLRATFARTAGIILILLLLIVIVIRYCLLCREREHAGQ